MSDENPKSQITDIANAIAAVAKEVPVYQDAIQPAAKQVGKGLETVTKAINVALAPLEGLVWGYDKIKKFINEKMAEKLRHIPSEQIQHPKPSIAVPTIEALRYTGSEPDIAELFANLLASSMTTGKANEALPSFVEIIKNLSSDEARIVRYIGEQSSINFPIVQLQMVNRNGMAKILVEQHVSEIGVDSNCEFPSNTAVYLENLARLGMIEIKYDSWISDANSYSRLEADAAVRKFKETHNTDLKDYQPEVQRGVVTVTPLGKLFVNTCARG